MPRLDMCQFVAKNKHVDGPVDLLNGPQVASVIGAIGHAQTAHFVEIKATGSSVIPKDGLEGSRPIIRRGARSHVCMGAGSTAMLLTEPASGVRTFLSVLAHLLTEPPCGVLRLH